MENARADLLSRLTTLKYVDIQKMTYLKVLEMLSIEEEPNSILHVDFNLSLIDPLIDYLQDGKLCKDRKQA